MIHRCQQGFTTVTLMGVLMVGGLLIAAAFAAVDPDIGLTKKDEDSKQAYAAAEAGVNYYMNRLGQDINYYLKCTNVPNPAGPGTNPVNQVWNGSGADPRTFYNIPGYTAKYAIELLPVTSGGYTSCVQNQQGSMIDPSTGALRIRSTGISGKRKRSIISTIRRKSFIDFLYFTNFETSDPATYATADDQKYASDNCMVYRADRGNQCDVISFISDDNLAGPFHTNDDAKICGTPTFGRDTNDLVEFNGASPGYSTTSGCSGGPNILGKPKWPAGILPMPKSNAALASVAAPAYSFSGETRIQLNGSSMTVTTASGTQTLAIPGGAVPGVVYVKSTSCTGGYKRQQTIPSPLPTGVPFSGDTNTSGCGNVYVSGSYTGDLTIGADNDIIVTDDLTTPSGSGALLGLIANNFVRVYHPVTFGSGNGGCTNNNGPGSIEIDAAILAIQHSFINDNWYCGSPLGTLTVKGAIAQQFRGPVGTHSGSSVSSGYAKAYTYNDNLRYREPPYFIDPAISPWQIIRQNEQVPPR